jgi:hypothetical protein
VEGALEHDDLGRLDPAAVRMLSRQLDCALVRFGARVAEEGLAAQARLAKPLGELHPRLTSEQVGDVHQRAGLLANRLDHGRMAMAERADRDPGQEVQIAASLGIP